MLTKTHILSISLIAISLTLVLVLRHSIVQLENAMLGMKMEQRVMEDYILSSFNENNLQDKTIISDICQPYLCDTNYVVYLPKGLCRACFSSLIFSFQDKEVPGNRIIVICGEEDIQVKSECFSRGIQYVVNSQPIEAFSNIMLFRLYNGFLPIALEYNLGREQLLTLFFSNDERLLQILSGIA